MKKWELVKRVVTFGLVAALATIPFVLVLAAVGTFIATLAMHLGDQIAGGHSIGAQIPTWLDPARIVSAIGSSIAALSGALIAILTIEYQRLRNRAGVRSAVRALLDEALASFEEYRRLQAANDPGSTQAREDFGGALIASMTITEKSSGDDQKMARLFAKMRPRARHFSLLAGEGDPMKLIYSAYKTAADLADQIPSWRALLD